MIDFDGTPLKDPKEIKRCPPNKASPPAETIVEIKEREYEPFEDSWPVYEEPFVTIQ